MYKNPWTYGDHGFTWLVVTHVSIVTFETFQNSYDFCSMAHKTLRYFEIAASVYLFSPDTFSVLNNSTSELLRFHDRMAASKPTS